MKRIVALGLVLRFVSWNGEESGDFVGDLLHYGPVIPLNDGTHRIVAGKYRLLALIGKGGMGSVWRADHLALRSLVAIKLVEPAVLTHPDAHSRFLREAQAAASLRSPHVVQILDYGVDGELPYIVMELLEGESLASRLERLGKLTPRATAELMSQVCRAIARAHENGVVHRDLKPDNIFITANDDSEIVKVLDFGIAKHTFPGGHGMTQTGTVLGTPYYMSPEQTEGAKDVDFRSDLWALSVIAYECVVGQRPFDGDSIGALTLAICVRPAPIPSQNGWVPSGFDSWFARGICRDRLGRFESARELAASLRRVCGLEESERIAGAQGLKGPTSSQGGGFAPASFGVGVGMTVVESTVAGNSVAGSLTRSVHGASGSNPSKTSSGFGVALLLAGVVALIGASVTGLWVVQNLQGRLASTSPDQLPAAAQLPSVVPPLAPVLAIAASSASGAPQGVTLAASPSNPSAAFSPGPSASAAESVPPRASAAPNPSQHALDAKPGSVPGAPVPSPRPTPRRPAPQVDLGI